MKRALQPLPRWRVELAGHDLPPRWRIPATAVELPSPSAGYAIRRVIAWAHSDADVPPWKPYVRQSVRYATAELVGAALATLREVRREFGLPELEAKR